MVVFSIEHYFAQFGHIRRNLLENTNRVPLKIVELFLGELGQVGSFGLREFFFFGTIQVCLSGGMVYALDLGSSAHKRGGSSPL
jgi:hypothetical protein